MTKADGFVWTSEPWGPALRCSSLGEVADHLFTTRQLRLRGGDEARDWACVAGSIGVAVARLRRLTQVHGARVVVARGDGWTDRPEGDGRPRADIAISDDPSVAVVVQVADCVPLLMADRRTGAVAAVHAGWRGTVAAAGPVAVAALARTYGVRPDDLVVAAGPSIGPCCYTVRDDVLEAFRAAGFDGKADRWFSRDGDGALRLDLWKANCDQLREAGVPAGQIHQPHLCTASHPDLFASYRRDGTGTGRVAAVIRARPR